MKKVLFLLLVLPLAVSGQLSIVSTIAGTGAAAYGGDGGPATGAALQPCYDLAMDATGNIYIADVYNRRVRVIRTNGNIYNFAGNGTAICSTAPGLMATSTSLITPRGLAVDANGQVYIADNSGAHVIRRVDTAGRCWRVGGVCGSPGYFGDGGRASSSSSFSFPSDVAVDRDGNLIIADQVNNMIRKIDTAGFLTSIAGTLTAATTGDGGRAATASIYYPNQLAIDGTGNIYFTDGSHRIRKINTSGIISTICGTGASGFFGDGSAAVFAKLNQPDGLAFDKAGNLYVADKNNNRIRCIDPFGIITTIGGTGRSGYSGEGAPAVAVNISAPKGICTDWLGNIYVTDAFNRVRRILLNTFVPMFTGGRRQVLTICENDVLTLDGALTITDGDVGQTETWTVPTTPRYGTITAGYQTISAGGSLSPYSFLYQPRPSFSGWDVFKVVISDGHSTDTVEITVHVVARPEAGLMLATDICEGATDSFTYTGAAGGVWTTSFGNISIGADGVATGVTPGIDTVTYNFTNMCGSDVSQVVLNVNPLPHAGAIRAPSMICPGTVDTLRSSEPDGVWSIYNSNITLTDSVITGVIPGRDTVVYTVTNACGIDSTTSSITVEHIPDAGIVSGPATVCESSAVVFTDSIAGGTWRISNGAAGIAPDSLLAIVSGLHAGVDTVTYTYTNFCGTDVASAEITVLPLPHAGTISGVAATCPGSVDTLTGSVAGGLWAAVGGHLSMFSTSSGAVIRGLTAGIDTIIHLVTNSCGIDTVTREVIVHPLPDAGTLSGLAAICPGASDTVASTVTGGAWSLSNGNASLAGNIITAVVSGLDTVYYIYTNFCGSDTSTGTVTISPLPDAGIITGVTELCPHATDSLLCTATGGLWSALGGHLAIHPSSTGSVITSSTPGTDTIIHLVTNSCGWDTSMRFIRVRSLPDPGIITGSAFVCPGGTDTLSASVTGGMWSTVFGRATVSAGIVRGVSSGRDTVKYAVTDVCGTSITSFPITIRNMPNAGSILGFDSLCAGLSGSLSYTKTGGTWAITNDNAVITGTTGLCTVRGQRPGRDTVLYIVSGICGYDTAMRSFTVKTVPDAGVISGSASVCIGASVTLTDTAAGGRWTVVNGHASADINSGAITGVKTGNDTIIYTVGNNCGVAFTAHAISVKPLPNAGRITGGLGNHVFMCLHDTIVLSATVAGGTWRAKNSSVVVTNGRIMGRATGTNTISYSVTNTCGTAVTTLPILVDSCVVHELPVEEHHNLVHIYPNPITDKIVIETEKGNFDHYSIIGIDGLIAAQGVLKSPTMEVFVDKLPTGVYFIRLTGQFGVWSERMFKD